MSAQRIGTFTVCLTADTLPYAGPAGAQGSGRPSPAPFRAPPRACEGWGGGGPSSIARELAVGRPVRTGRLGAEPLDLVLLVVLEVALEPEPPRVALVGEDVRRHPVEEPPVVAHDHGAAGELQQR